MNWGLTLALFAPWFVHTITDEGKYGPMLFLDPTGNPVILYRDTLGTEKPIRRRWQGSAWVTDTIPFVPRGASLWAALDSSGHLHLVTIPPTDDTLFLASETDTGWRYYTYIPEDHGFPLSFFTYAFTVSPQGNPHFILGVSYLGDTMAHVWMEGDTWSKEIFCSDTDTLCSFLGDMRFDGEGNLHLAMESVVPHLLWYGLRDSSGWRMELVDPMGDEGGDFCFSLCEINVDWWGTPRIHYWPYYENIVAYRNKYAERTLYGWVVEFTGLGGILITSNYAVTPDSVVHVISPHNDGTLWHAIRKGLNEWEEVEFIAPGIWPTCLTSDQNGYLHFVCHESILHPEKYRYITNNPTIGVSESHTASRQSLVLQMASGGFWITGYSGEAQIYDPAGRLVLSRKIRDKILISPLKPGVYFVVAGKQRTRIAIR
ncbi:MAG: T9SS type A sorting domain-containing protein [candidate division WOR-3 bacterium]